MIEVGRAAVADPTVLGPEAHMGLTLQTQLWKRRIGPIYRPLRDFGVAFRFDCGVCRVCKSTDYSSEDDAETEENVKCRERDQSSSGEVGQYEGVRDECLVEEAEPGGNL